MMWDPASTALPPQPQPQPPPDIETLHTAKLHIDCALEEAYAVGDDVTYLRLCAALRELLHI